MPNERDDCEKNDAYCDCCRITLDTERELLRCLAEKEPTFVEFSHYLSESVLFPPARLSAYADWKDLL